MKKLLLLLLTVHFFSCSSPENQVVDNSADKETFDSNVRSFQTKFIKGFENEDHEELLCSKQIDYPEQNYNRYQFF